LRQSGSPADRKEGETEAVDFVQVPVVLIVEQAGLAIARQSFTVQLLFAEHRHLVLVEQAAG